MKKVLLACALTIAMMASYAQSSSTTPSRTPPQEFKAKTEAERKQDLEKVIVKLNATKEQAATIRNAYNSLETEKKKLESLKKTDSAAYKTQVKAVGESLVKEINAVLTPEQQKTFAAILEEHNNSK